MTGEPILTEEERRARAHAYRLEQARRLLLAAGCTDNGDGSFSPPPPPQRPDGSADGS